MFGSSFLPVVCSRAYVLFICVCLLIVVSNTYCVMFCFIFLRLVYPMLPFSLDCPFMTAPSVFSKVCFTLYFGHIQ